MIELSFLGYPSVLLMGVALGLTGGGGSILTVPILVYLFGVGAYEATAYSLCIVGLVALWGAFRAYKSGELHLNRALFFGIPGVFGVVLSRRVLLPLVPQELTIFSFSFSQNAVILIFFAFLMLLASISMIRASQITKKDIENIIKTHSVSNVRLSIYGLLVGLTAGFVGAGGGFLIVPALVSVGKLEMKQAIGTSLFVIAFQSLLGVLGDYRSLFQIDIFLFLVIVLLAIVGMSIGIHFKKYIQQSTLKLGFGVFVLVVGSLILIQELGKGRL